MPAHILILGSDRQLTTQRAAYLKLKGYKVTAHVDPQHAISLADTRPPALVIIDLLLAGRSGIEFLYELRSYPEWLNIPVIITGQQSLAEVQPFGAAFAELGVSSYLPTAWTSLAQLEQVISGLLQPVAV